MALNQSSLSSHYSPSPFNRSTTPPRFQRSSLKLPFLFNDHPNLVMGRAQIPKSGSDNIVSDPNIDGFGPKKALQCDQDEGSLSSSAIDFLTLCHSLKVLFNFMHFFFCNFLCKHVFYIVRICITMCTESAEQYKLLLLGCDLMFNILLTLLVFRVC